MTILEHNFLVNVPKLLEALLNEVTELKADLKEVKAELKRVKGEK